MAANNQVARRYADALISAADDSGQTDILRSHLTGMASLLDESPEFARIAHDPTISAGDKREAVVEALGESVAPIVRGFLELLITHHRESALADIVDAGLSRLDEMEGVVGALVTSPVALSESQKSALVSQLETRTGKKIRLEAAVDTEITGGFTVKIGDAIYDATVAAQLRRIREQMTRPL